MSDSSFISILGRDLIPVLKETPPDEVILTEKGIDYTAAQVLKVVEAGQPTTMYHIPRPR